MHLNADVSSALQQMEAVKKGIEESDDPKLQMNTAESLKIIMDILQDPVFRTIVQVQDSLSELNTQIAQHPSILPNDFDIDVTGNLVLSVPADPGYDVDYTDEQRVPSAQMSPRSPNSPASNTGHYLDMDSLDHLSGDDHSTFMKKSRGFSDLTRSADDERPQSVVSDSSKHAVDLFTYDYVRVQAIELVNDGTGLGFGIIGARTSGVIAKTILPHGVAGRDGRLRSGDHILQIGNVNLHNMDSEQVASVLRQSGTHVRLVVARPIEHMIPQYELEPNCAIVPSRVLLDPIELERHLIATGYPDIFGDSSCASTPQTTTEDERFVYNNEMDVSKRPPMAMPFDLEELELPETEKLQVELTKDANGLGITIAGYVCEKEELSGIFVKSVSPGSAADMSGKIQVNDRIIEVDGQSLQGYSNHQAVELLKKSGQIVNLRLERYLRGPKYDQLQQAIAANDKIPSIPSTPARALPPTPQRKSSIGVKMMSSEETSDAPSETFSNSVIIDRKVPAPPKETVLSSFGNGKKLITARDSIEVTKIIPTEVPISHIPESKVEEVEEPELAILHAKNAAVITKHKYHVDPELTPELMLETTKRWNKILGSEVEVIVAQIKKLTAASGLGISLEGTVDVEGGKEVRPHHYIRSILPEGPVGMCGALKSGDELLEVNGQRLLGMNHLEVVAILKELPQDVRMVCGRSRNIISIIDEPDSLMQTNSNLDKLLPATDRLVKAKSDGSLATTGSGPEDSFTKLKSRSLEPLTGLAMWASEPQIIELVKGDRGLGFSILDYQDPLDPNDTLIVIRSLVPGGVAQMDGRLIPGDRLLFVNNTNLENASLDQAVQALKGAQKGVVRIGVAKPLPMTDNSIRSTTSTEANTSTFSNASTVEPDVIPEWRK